MGNYCQRILIVIVSIDNIGSVAHRHFKTFSIAMNNPSSSKTTALSIDFSSRATKPKEFTSFKRTNRIDGQSSWIKELVFQHYNSTGLAEINSIIEISKELLYSGIPEQVLEVHNLYC
jgi:hypothetical protein